MTETKRIRKSCYKDKSGITLETNLVSVTFTPDPGGKMVSLKCLKTGYEYLVQRPGKQYRDQPFGGSYVDGECSGMDDMFPTIDACQYTSAPWEGTYMADHGEVWSLPWKWNIFDDHLHMAVRGMRFPYELKKTISFTNENTIRMAYELKNESESDFEFLWAGHFMVNIEEGTRVVLPGDCQQAVSMLSNSGKPPGSVVDWPIFLDTNGEEYDASISRPATSMGFEKYYFTNKLKQGWCSLEYPTENKKLTISFSQNTVPYLGILMNENGWDNLYNIFIEPCTVCYDRPDLAKKYGQVSKVKAKETYFWQLEITIEN